MQGAWQPVRVAIMLKRIARFAIITLGLALLAGASIYFFFPSFILNTLVLYERSRAGLEQKEIEVAGHRIVYLENRAANGQETIVFVHGFGADKDNWTRMARYLTGDYHLVALDLPGFGESSRIDTVDYNLPAQAARLRRFITLLKLGPDGRGVHLVGNSMGGNIIGLFALLAPGETRSLAFFNPGGIESSTRTEYEKTFAETGRNMLLVNSAADFDRLMKLAMYRPPYIPGPIKEYFAKRAVQNRAFNEKIYGDAFVKRRDPLEPILGNIQTPALVLWGKEDRILDVSGAAIMHAKLPHSQLRIMDECGHAPMIEKPARAAGHLREFLANPGGG